MRKTASRVHAFTLALLLIGARPVPADEPTAFDDVTMNVSSPFAAGTWSVNPIGGAYLESFGGHSELLTFGGVDIEGMIFDHISGFAEFVGYSVDQTEPDAAAFGFSLGSRWYLLRPTPELSIFTEIALGVFEGDRRVPTHDGTHFNFTIISGLGVRYQLTDSVALIASGRYFHLSNAAMQGEARNPSIDAFGGFGGITITF